MPNAHSLRSDHHRHDRLLVARHAVGDVQPAEHREAEALIRSCAECAALAADISSISVAVAQLPAAPRPRDFRLTPEQAGRLRGSQLERWLRSLTGSGWATVRPMAAVALSIGMVMSVVGMLPILGAAPGTPLATVAGDQNFGPGREIIPSAGPSEDGAGQPGPQEPSRAEGSPAAAALEDDPFSDVYVNSSPPAQPAPGQSDVRAEDMTVAGPALPGLLLYAGLGLAALALFVLALLWAVQRRFYDPLLR